MILCKVSELSLNKLNKAKDIKIIVDNKLYRVIGYELTNSVLTVTYFDDNLKTKILKKNDFVHLKN